MATNDTTIFAQAYAKHKDAIMAYVACRIPNKYEAEDITQEVFIKLLTLGEVINETTVKSFLFTVAHNMVIDIIRRRYKRDEVMEAWKRDYTSQVTNTVEQTVYANELERAYECQISKLPTQRRNIYKMVSLDGAPINEVAQSLSLSKRTVESHLYIARNEVRNGIKRMLKVG